MLDTSGQPAGVSVEMAKAMGKYLQRPVRFLRIFPSMVLIPSLKTGKIDLVISSMTVTAESDQSRSIFSDPYLKMGLSILANKNSSIQSIADVDKPNTTVCGKKKKGDDRSYLRDPTLP